MYAPSLVRDWRPDPPTPTNRACERGCLITREIRDTCSIANLQVGGVVYILTSRLKESCVPKLLQLTIKNFSWDLFLMLCILNTWTWPGSWVSCSYYCTRLGKTPPAVSASPSTSLQRMALGSQLWGLRSRRTWESEGHPPQLYLKRDQL